MVFKGDLGDVSRTCFPALCRENVACNCNGTILIMEKIKKVISTGGPVSVSGAGVGWNSHCADTCSGECQNG